MAIYSRFPWSAPKDKGMTRRRKETTRRRSSKLLIANGHRSPAIRPLVAMNHTPPRTIYLPSSGGYTSSRIVPEVGSSTRGGSDLTKFPVQSIDRRRFPFRRYSIDEDGSLVCRSRNIGKEAYVCRFRLAPPQVLNAEHLDRRSRPYDTSLRATARDLPHRPRTPVSGQALVPPCDSASAAQILNRMIPAIIQDPTAFEESIPTVCAEHNIDPPILESLVQNLKLAQPASKLTKES